MKDRRKFVVGCNVIAAVCFAIASCGYFYSGRLAFGWIFAVLAAAQLVLAMLNHRGSMRNKESEHET